MRYRLADREDTAAFGLALGKLLRPGDVVALVGDLGAGKTTLTQALARGMRIASAVTSPTFTLIQEYRGPTPLFHIDPYRLERPEDVGDLGFDEYFERGGVVVIEWADKIAALLPEERLTLTMEYTDRGEADAEEQPRLLTAVPTGSRWIDILRAMNSLPEIRALLFDQTEEDR